MSGDLRLAGQWLAKARNDLLNADNNLNSDQIPFDTVCFHCQQAAEKLLKSFLVGNGQDYPISHDLLLILEQVIPLDEMAESLRDSLSLLMPYAVEIRYPDDGSQPTLEDTREARAAAQTVLDWLKSSHPSLFD